MGKMLTPEQVAAQLGVTADRVRMLCRGRRVRGARLVGRVWLIPEAFTITPGTRGPKMGK